MKASPEYNEDKLFRGEEENTAFLEDEFIPTLDRQGNTVYVLSEHIFVYFNDAREYKQRVIAKDPTDYRLEEPLPKKIPASFRDWPQRSVHYGGSPSLTMKVIPIRIRSNVKVTQVRLISI